MLAASLLVALSRRFSGGPCSAYGSDLKVQTARGFRYPDVSVGCTPFPNDALVVAEPVILFEVLSPSTNSDDRTTKLAEYKAIPSLRRYIMLEQDRAFATVITRTDTGWDHALLGPDAILAMPEIGVEIPITELYANLIPTTPP